MRSLLIFLGVLCLPLLGFAGDYDLLKSKMLTDLDVIKNTFSVKYAPAEWKKIYADWDLDQEIEIAKAKVLSMDTITVKDYQRILVSFLKTTRDYHVDITFHSTAMSYLPFRIHGADGRYFFAWVDYQNTSLPISKGDEILTFNGRPIGDVIADLKKSEFGNPESFTDQAKAEMLFTERLGAFGNEVPQGDVSITVKHLGSDEVFSYDLEWSYYPEEIKNDKVYKVAGVAKRMVVEDKEEKISSHPIFHRQMTAPFYPTLCAAVKRHYGLETISASEDGGPMPLGSRKSFVPLLGEVIWESSVYSNFYAYMYKTPDNKTVGYIRLSDYSGGSIGTERAAREFLDVINLFEAKTDALVIDQVDNPGGDVLYMYALASTLAKAPLELPKHRITITQQDVTKAITLRNKLAKKTSKASYDLDDTVSGYPITPELNASTLSYLYFVIDEWNAGRTFTSPSYLFGIETLQPNPKGNYTKPILFLVNEMSLSCGDFMPAILQDNNRATIFGARTAGAGGYIFSETHSNLFGIEEYVLTSSIAERKDLNPIENLGVIPDILYHLTADDLQNGYEGYFKAVQQAVQNLFKEQK